MNKNGTKNGSAKANGKRIELPPVDAEGVIAALLNTPRLLAEAESRRDLVKADLDKYAAGLSIDALSLAIFPGKGEGEKRIASTVNEQKQAADYLLANEREFQALRAEAEAAEREARMLRNQLDCIQLVARLIIHQTQN